MDRRPRVVSLLPSATEMLCAIPGGRAVLVGRSHECDWPTGGGPGGGVTDLPVLTRQRVRGGTPAEIDQQVREIMAHGESLYELDEACLAGLRPDVILTQDLCAVCSIDLGSVRRVAERIGARVVSLNAETFEGVLDDMVRVGEAVALIREAERAVVGLRERVYAAGEFATPFVTGPSVAFLEWTDPLFVGGHWTPQLIERAGGVHPLNPTEPVAGAGAGEGPIGATQRRAGKSVRVPQEVVAASRPERVIVCPCGVGLEGAIEAARGLMREVWFARLPAASVPGGVAAVDGSAMFNRPGPRLVEAFEWLVGWLNDRPELIPQGFPWAVVKAGA